jgi:hypothetical protein
MIGRVGIPSQPRRNVAIAGGDRTATYYGLTVFEVLKETSLADNRLDDTEQPAARGSALRRTDSVGEGECGRARPDDGSFVNWTILMRAVGDFVEKQGPAVGVLEFARRPRTHVAVRSSCRTARLRAGFQPWRRS